MSVYRPKNSPFYHFDFWLRGRRFLGSTGSTSKRTAQALESERKAQAQLEVAARDYAERQLKGALPLSLDVAAGRWWIEVGQHRRDATTCWKDTERMLAWFGPSKRLDQITDGDVARWVAERRGERVWARSNFKDGRSAPLLSPARVNRATVDCLRRIYGRARKSWKLAFANEPAWGAHRLPEPEERVRELGLEEQRVLGTVGRDEYEKVYRFARLSGLRLASCLIRKSDVKWDVGRIDVRSKGGKLNRVPLSAPIRALLAECWNDHPEFAFTYASMRAGQGRARGQRTPITVSGLKSQWKRDRAKAVKVCPSLVDFRFHDHRHTAATRILRSSRNLKVAQKLLNHARITTTAKYAHVLDEEVLEAMNAVPDSGEKSRTVSRTKRRGAA